MEGKECKIICDDKEVGTISCTGNGFKVEFAEDWKKMHEGCCKKE